MRRLAVLASALAMSLLSAATSAAAQTHIEAIRGRLSDANRWRDHVMVVAHRGGGVEAGHSRFAENSIAAVRHSIAIGVEMVELDVQRSKDGVFVIFHDSWLDRSSTCKGRLAERTLAELKTCRLVVEGTGQATPEPIPTLDEMLRVTRDRIFVNIDNKLELSDLPAMIDVARSLGMDDQIVVKANLWNIARIEEARALKSRLGRALFMPIVADDAVRSPSFLRDVAANLSPPAIELIAWRDGASRLTGDGGPLFSGHARAAAVHSNWHLWINTYAIVNKESGMLSGGRGDQLATLAGLPDEVWGFWIERGVTMIQTDEPTAAVRWLEANGWRIPYAAVPVSTAQSGTAPSN